MQVALLHSRNLLAPSSPTVFFGGGRTFFLLGWVFFIQFLFDRTTIPRPRDRLT